MMLLCQDEEQILVFALQGKQLRKQSCQSMQAFPLSLALIQRFLFIGSTSFLCE